MVELDLSTCLDREEAPQLHGGTMLSLAILSSVGPHAVKAVLFLAKENLCLLRDKQRPGVLRECFPASVGK